MSAAIVTIDDSPVGVVADDEDLKVVLEARWTRPMSRSGAWSPYGATTTAPIESDSRSRSTSSGRASPASVILPGGLLDEGTYEARRRCGSSPTANGGRLRSQARSRSRSTNLRWPTSSMTTSRIDASRSAKRRESGPASRSADHSSSGLSSNSARGVAASAASLASRPSARTPARGSCCPSPSVPRDRGDAGTPPERTGSAGTPWPAA